MPKYFIHNGSEQQGPYTLKELKDRKIKSNTPIWYEGLTDWTEAVNINELKDYFKSTPPPFGQKEESHPPIKKSNLGKTIAIILVILVAGSLGINYFRNEIGSNINPRVKPPLPKVLNSRTETDPNATVLDYKQAVYATIYNEGGRGNVLVTATINQGKRNFKEVREIFLAEGASKEVYLMFDGPKALGGSIRYEVFVKSIN